MLSQTVLEHMQELHEGLCKVYDECLVCEKSEGFLQLSEMQRTIVRNTKARTWRSIELMEEHCL